MVNQNNKKIVIQLYTDRDFEKGINPHRKLEMIEQEWKKSIRVSEHELSKIFPEAKSVVLEKLKEWEIIHENIKTVIEKKLRIINEKSAQGNQWFWKGLVSVIDGKKLIEAEKHIARLKRLKALYSNSSPPKNRISQSDIDRAVSIPIEEVLNIKLKRSGNKLVGSCPFHNEKTPSFYVYLKSNSFYCFGCQKGGNIINLIQILYGYSFIETVKYLLKL